MCRAVCYGVSLPDYGRSTLIRGTPGNYCNQTDSIKFYHSKISNYLRKCLKKLRGVKELFLMKENNTFTFSIILLTLYTLIAT